MTEYDNKVATDLRWVWKIVTVNFYSEPQKKKKKKKNKVVKDPEVWKIVVTVNFYSERQKKKQKNKNKKKKRKSLL